MNRKRSIAFSALMLFFGVAGHTLFETTRDSLFLQRVPISRLPWMYLILAAFAVVYSFAPMPNAQRGDPRAPFFRWSIATAAVSALFALFGPRAGIYGFYAMYLWSGFSGAILLSQAWILITRNVSGYHAKSDLAFVAIGGVVGGGAGALIARIVLTPGAGTTPLLLVSGLFVLAVASSIPLRADDEERALTMPERSMDGASVLLKDPYLRTVTALGFLSFFSLTLLDVSYKTTLGRQVVPVNIPKVLATVSLAGNILSLVLQVFVARVGLRFLGTVALAVMLPFVLTVTSLGWAASGALVFLVIARVLDQGMRFSTQKTASELLLLPIGDTLRAKIKPILDVLLQRLAQGAASVVALIAIRMHLRTWGALVAGSMCVWLVVALFLRVPYKRVFAQALRGGILRSTVVLRPFGREGTATLVAALSSDNEAEVEAALALLQEQRLTHLVPGLILYHPNRAIVERGMALLIAARRKDAEVPLRRIIEVGPDDVRAAALRGLGALGAPDETFRDLLGSTNVELRATAIAVLFSRGAMSFEEASQEMDEPSEIETIRAVLRAIAANPSPVFARTLESVKDLAADGALVELVRAMGSLHDPRFVPNLIGYLARREARSEARAALAALGEPAQAALEDRLFDPQTPRAVVTHLPRSLARFANERAVGMLLRVAEEHPEGVVRFKALRGLGGMLARQPRLGVSAVRLTRMLDKAIADIRTLAEIERPLAQEKAEGHNQQLVHRLLVDFVAGRRSQALERLFRLLAIRFPQEDLYRIYGGLTSSDPQLRRQSKELLETVLRGPARVPTLGLLAFLEEEDQGEPQAIEGLLDRIDSLESGMGREIVARYRTVLPPRSPASVRPSAAPAARVQAAQPMREPC